MTFVFSPFTGDIYPIGPRSVKSLHDAYDKIAAYKSTALKINYLQERFAFYDRRDPDKIEAALNKFSKLIKDVWLPVNYSPFCTYVYLQSDEQSGKKKARLVKTKEEFETAKENFYDDHKLKLRYIYKKFFDDEQIIEYLFKFMEKYSFISWHNIIEHQDTLRDYIGITVEKIIRLIVNNEDDF